MNLDLAENPAGHAEAPDSTARGATSPPGADDDDSQTVGVPDPGPQSDGGARKLDTIEAARLVGVSPSTWRSWRARGRPRPEPVPAPDGWFELRTPWWWESTITAWVRRRRPIG